MVRMPRLVLSFGGQETGKGLGQVLLQLLVGEIRVVSLTGPRGRQPLERFHTRIAVLSVSRNYVLVGGDTLEKILLDAVTTSMVLHLQQVDVNLAVRQEARAFEPLENEIASGIAR